MKTIDHIDLAVMALHDYGTRDGATAKKVMKQMRAAGFNDKEIAQATERMK